MDARRRYFRFVLSLVRWITIAISVVSGFIIIIAVSDLMFGIGWGYSWSTMPLLLVYLAIAIVINRLASSWLRDFNG